MSIGEVIYLYSLYCKRILQVKEEVGEETCRVWARVVIGYNDLFSAKYRSVERPSDAKNSHLLENSVRNLRKFYEAYFVNEDNANILRLSAGKNFKTSYALIEANIALSEDKFAQGDYAAMILYLESALSAIHDLVDILTEVLCE